jgi:hypothetical protein
LRRFSFSGESRLAGLDFHFIEKQRERMADLTKPELMEKILKLVQTSRDLNFLMSLEEKDLTELLIAFRERIENQK